MQIHLRPKALRTSGFSIIELLLGIGIGTGALILMNQVFLRARHLSAAQEMATDLASLGKEFESGFSRGLCSKNFENRNRADGLQVVSSALTSVSFGWLRPDDKTPPTELQSQSLKIYKFASGSTTTLDTKPWIAAGTRYGNTVIKSIRLSRELSTTVKYNLYSLHIDADVSRLGPGARPISIEIPIPIQESSVPDTIASCSYDPGMDKVFTAATCAMVADSVSDGKGGCVKSKFSVTYIGPAYGPSGPMVCPAGGSVTGCRCIHAVFKPSTNPSQSGYSTMSGQKLDIATKVGDFQGAAYKIPRAYNIKGPNGYALANLDHSAPMSQTIKDTTANGCDCRWDENYPTSWGDDSNHTPGFASAAAAGCSPSSNPLDCFGHIQLTCSFKTVVGP